MQFPTPKRRVIPIRFDQATIDQVDALSAPRNPRSKVKEPTRSDFIRQAVAEKIKSMERTQAQIARDALSCRWCGIDTTTMEGTSYYKNFLGEIEVICRDCARPA